MLNIKEYRERAGLTQAELAENIEPKVTQSAISHWEAGACFPSIPILMQLTKIFNCSMNDLTEQRPA